MPLMPLNSSTPVWHRLRIFFGIWLRSGSLHRARTFCYAAFHPDNDDKEWLVKGEDGLVHASHIPELEDTGARNMTAEPTMFEYFAILAKRGDTRMTVFPDRVMLDYTKQGVHVALTVDSTHPCYTEAVELAKEQVHTVIDPLSGVPYTAQPKELNRNE